MRSIDGPSAPPRRAAAIVLPVTLLVALVVGFLALDGLLVDWLWFGTLGFEAVFWTIWSARLVVFGIAAGTSAAALATNALLATTRGPARVGRPHLVRVGGNGGIEGLRDVIDLSPDRVPWRTIAVAIASLVALFIGLGQAGSWDVFLKWWHAAPFGRADPVFGHDLGFYVFTLPVLAMLRDWAFLSCSSPP